MQTDIAGKGHPSRVSYLGSVVQGEIEPRLLERPCPGGIHPGDERA